MLLSTKSQFQNLISNNEDYEFVANYKDLCFRSVYQPIFDIDNRVIGLEALVRIADSHQHQIRPDMFFDSPNVELEDKINVERLSRVIHIRNFAQSECSHLRLFLNVLPSAGEYFALDDIRTNLLYERLLSLDLAPDQFVMEVVEHEARDEACLQNAMNKLSEVGFNIAIDDFGMHASNHQRVERIKPSIIKIDRSLLLLYMEGNTQPLLNGIDIAKRIDAKVVVEGIETQQQHQAMKQLKVDYYQGYFLAIPQKIDALRLGKLDLS